MAQLKDLIVTGASRFLNNIYGNLIGNATSADKVNHTFSVLDVNFDGSADASVTIEDLNRALGASDAMKLVGKLDKRVTELEDGKANSVINTSTGKHVIFLSEVYASQREIESGTISINGTNTNVKYYTPGVGDVVLQDDFEYVCIAITSTGSGGNYKVTSSTWRSLDSSGYWHTW